MVITKDVITVTRKHWDDALVAREETGRVCTTCLLAQAFTEFYNIAIVVNLTTAHSSEGEINLELGEVAYHLLCTFDSYEYDGNVPLFPIDVEVCRV